MTGLSGSIHPEARHILERFSIPTPPEINPEEAKEIVLIDTSIIRDNDPRISLERVIEVIDHRHTEDAHRFPNAKLQIELIGAAATLVAERWQATPHLPSRESAILLYAGIASNTANWKSSVTTPRDHAMAAWLKSVADIPADLVTTMFQSKSDLTGEKLRDTIFNDFAWRSVGDKITGIAQLEILDAEQLIRSRTNDLSTILQELLSAHAIDNAFVSAIDLGRGENWFFVPDKELQQLLSGALRVTFVDDIARHPHILMRKQLGPILRNWHADQTS